MSFWRREEINPSDLVPGDGRNRRRRTVGFSPKKESSDRDLAGVAGVGGDQGSVGVDVPRRSGPVTSTVGGRKVGFRSGRVEGLSGGYREKSENFSGNSNFL